MLLQTSAVLKDFRATGTREGGSRDPFATDGITAVILTHVTIQGVSGGEGLIAPLAKIGRHVFILDAIRIDTLLSAGTLSATVLRAVMVMIVGRLPAATSVP